MNLYEPWKPGDLPPECLEILLRLKKNRGTLPRDWLMCDMGAPTKPISDFEQASDGTYTSFSFPVRYMLRRGIAPPELEKWTGLHLTPKQATTPAERLSAGETVEIRGLTDAEFDELERVWNEQPPENRHYSACESGGFIQVGPRDTALRDMRRGSGEWYAKLLVPGVPKPPGDLEPEPKRMGGFAVGDEVELTQDLTCTQHRTGDRGVVMALTSVMGNDDALSVKYARTGETCSTWPRRLKHVTLIPNEPKTKKEQAPMTLIKIERPVLINGSKIQDYCASDRDRLLKDQEARIKAEEAREFKTQETLDEIAAARANIAEILKLFDDDYAARKAATAAK